MKLTKDELTIISGWYHAAIQVMTQQIAERGIEAVPEGTNRLKEWHALWSRLMAEENTSA